MLKQLFNLFQNKQRQNMTVKFRSIIRIILIIISQLIRFSEDTNTLEFWFV